MPALRVDTHWKSALRMELLSTSFDYSRKAAPWILLEDDREVTIEAVIKAAFFLTKVREHSLPPPLKLSYIRPNIYHGVQLSIPLHFILISPH